MDVLILIFVIANLLITGGNIMESSSKTFFFKEHTAPTPLTSNHTIIFNEKEYSCSVGRNGIHTNKKEGDGATPAGIFPIRRIFYRDDNLTPKQKDIMRELSLRGFQVQALTENDLWCDDPKSPYYNQYINRSQFSSDKIPSHEELYRSDSVYDIILVLGYNDKPIVHGKGSAIFVHVARYLTPTISPTEGCIALAKPDLLSILKTMTPSYEFITDENSCTIQIKDLSKKTITLKSNL